MPALSLALCQVLVGEERGRVTEEHWEGVSEMTETPSDFEGCSVHEGDTWRERTLGCEVWAGTVTCPCSSDF